MCSFDFNVSIWVIASKDNAEHRWVFLSSSALLLCLYAGTNPSRPGGFPGANSPGPVADLYGPSSQDSAVGNYISAASPQPGSGFGPSITVSTQMQTSCHVWPRFELSCLLCVRIPPLKLDTKPMHCDVVEKQSDRRFYYKELSLLITGHYTHLHWIC